MTRRPDLFIIGAPKSGTTSIYDYLRGHPDVFMSPVKEPAYFSVDVPRPHERFPYGSGLDDYLSLFADATTEKRLGEASTYYLYSRQAPALLREFQPDARLVAILRNPVDMAHSLHAHRLAHENESIADFGEALAADERPDGGGPERLAVIERAGAYRARAKYAEQLDRWFSEFARDRFHVMIFEDFVAKPAREFRRLLEFLEVDPDYQPEAFEARNPSHKMPKGWLAVVKSRPSQFIRRQLLPALIGKSRVANVGRQFKRSRFVRRPTARAPLDPNTRRRLEDDLADDVERLSRMLGRDLVNDWFRRIPPGATG